MNGLVLESLGWALLHLLWQGTLVAAVLALALRVIGRQAAVARYALACGALALMLALPVATFGRHYASAAPASSAEAAVSTAVPAPAPATFTAPTFPAPRHAFTPAAPVFASGAELATLPGQALGFVGQSLPWLVLAWGLGVALSSLRLLAGWLRLRRLVRAATPAPLEWQQRLEALSSRLGMKRAVRLLQSAAVEVPSAVGWLRPVVLLPASALTGLTTRQLEMILAHELAHIRRYDFVVNLAQTLVETLLFYHPAVWWVSRVIRVEREHCCDDIAAGTSGSALSYARALTALEELRVLPSLAPNPALSALGGSLPERVRRLVLTPASRCSSRWVAGASVLTLMSSLAVAAPITALMLPAENPTGGSLATSISAPPSAPSAPAPAEAPAPVAAQAPVSPPAPVSAPAPVPGPRVAARPNPTPNPNPQPRHGRDEDEDEDDADHDDEDDRTRVGEGPLSVDQLVSLRIAGVTPEMLETVKGLGYEPTVSNLVQFGHAGITAEYVKDMNVRFGQKVSAEDLVAMKHLGVTPAWLEAMKAQGFTKLSAEDAASAKAVGVDEKYLSALKSAGYTGLSLEDVTEMRAVGVKPETIAGLSQAGYPKLDKDTLVQFHALGVTPEYLRSLNESGLKNLSADQLVELRALDVNAGFIRQMRDAGLENLDVDTLVKLRTSGIDGEFIRRMKKPQK